MSFQGASLYTQGYGTRSENVEIPLVTNRPPTSSDINYPLGKRWIDQIANTVYELTSFSSGGGSVSATWTYLAQAAGALNNLIASDLTVVTPVAGSINVFQGSGLVTTGAGNTLSVSVDVPLDVNFGGTGAVSLTANSVIVGNGTSAVSAVGPALTGEALMGNTGFDPVFTGSPSFSGAVTAATGFVATTGGVTVTAGGVEVVAGGVLVDAGGATISGTTLINTSTDDSTTIGNTAGAGALTLNAPASGFSIVGSGNFINIGTDAAANVVTVGTLSAGSSTIVNAGPNGITIDGSADCPIQIGESLTTAIIDIGGTSQTGTISIAPGTVAQTVNIANDIGGKTVAIASGADVNAVTLGSSASTSITTLQAGSGGLNTVGPVNIAITGNDTVAIGNAAGTGAITINTGSGDLQVNANGNEIHIGDDAAINTVVIGTQTGTSALTLNAGSTGITYNGNIQGNGYINLSAGNTLGYEIANLGGDACGTAILVGGAATVNTSACSTNSLILVVVNDIGTVLTPQVMAVPTATILNGSFLISSADPTDTSTVTWFIFNTF